MNIAGAQLTNNTPGSVSRCCKDKRLNEMLEEGGFIMTIFYTWECKSVGKKGELVGATKEDMQGIYLSKKLGVRGNRRNMKYSKAAKARIEEKRSQRAA